MYEVDVQNTLALRGGAPRLLARATYTGNYYHCLPERKTFRARSFLIGQFFEVGIFDWW